ncbi:MAG: sigma factor-like helix-turn-helix DNA-binding protein [Eubacteriales bacterium]
MKGQTYRMAMLFDFFGEVLTERQQEFFQLYYDEDLSLSEIAQRFDITRQGVRDVVSRAENILLDLEVKTGLVARFHTTREQLQELSQISQELTAYADRSKDLQLVELAKQLNQNLENLQREE